MGKRHNTLSDDIFRNSKYINTLEKALEIDDFRKEYKEQYDIMFDVYKTLIAMNNIFFADSNKNKKEKTYELLDTIEKIIYKSKDDDRAKYSTRTIKALIDSNTRLLYNKYNEWYESLSYNDNYFDTLKSDVEEEMTRLENVGFDSVVKGGISYEKNKNSNYKIYISKLDYLYPNNSDVWKEYAKNFYDTYGIELKEQEKKDICFIYKLIACANNGIVKLLFQDEIKDFELTDRDNAEDYLKAYLTSLNIDIKDNIEFYNMSDTFLEELLELNRFSIEQLKNKNEHTLKIANIETEPYIANYGLYFFYQNMERIKIGRYEFTIKADVIVKLINDLKEIYNLMYDNVPTITNENQVQEAFTKLQNIIDRNIKMFERLS